ASKRTRMSETVREVPSFDQPTRQAVSKIDRYVGTGRLKKDLQAAGYGIRDAEWLEETLSGSMSSLEGPPGILGALERIDDAYATASQTVRDLLSKVSGVNVDELVRIGSSTGRHQVRFSKYMPDQGNRTIREINVTIDNPATREATEILNRMPMDTR